MNRQQLQAAARARQAAGADGIPTIGEKPQPQQPMMVIDQGPTEPPLLLPGVAVCVLADNVVEQLEHKIVGRILTELVKHGVIRHPGEGIEIGALGNLGSGAITIVDPMEVKAQ